MSSSTTTKADKSPVPLQKTEKKVLYHYKSEIKKVFLYPCTSQKKKKKKRSIPLQELKQKPYTPTKAETKVL